MKTDRIKEIQQTTAYPESVSVKQALLQVWNECEQEYRSRASELPSDEKTLNKISNIIIRYKDEHIYIEEAEKQIIEEVISPILASHVARILELEEKVKLINGDLDLSLEIINSLRSSCP